MDELEAACGSDPTLLCETMFDWTGNENVAQWTDWFLDRPLRILFILFVAWFASRYARKFVTKFASSLSGVSNDDPDDSGALKRGIAKLGKLAERQQRAQQRADTLGAVLRSLVTAVVWSIALLLVLGELGINLAPLVAGAGVVGFAVGFGAQSIVRDFLSGLFVLIEDHYGVGDFIDVGDASGTVEEVSLRTTRLRDQAGVLWIVPNGEIRRVGNYSQLFSQTRMQFEVSYDTDVDEASAVIKGVLDEVWHENREDATEIEEPTVLGIDAFKDSAIVIGAVIKTDP